MAIMDIIGKIFVKAVESSDRPRCTAVIAAAGESSRMGNIDKLFAAIDGVPVIAMTLEVFQHSRYIDDIIIVTREESIVKIADICAAYGIEKATKVIVGADERLDSVLAGVREVPDSTEYIAIADAARPLVTEDIIESTVKAAFKHNAAAPAVPVKDTIKIAESRIVIETPDRKTLYAVQTPQVFKSELIKAALENAKNKALSVTDDCSAVEKLQACVVLSDGSDENIKITTPTDLLLAEAIVTRRKNENRTRI